METVDLGTFQGRCGDAFSLPIMGEEDGTGTLVNLANYGPTWASQLRKTPAGSLIASFTVDNANIAGAVDPSHDAPQLVLSLTGEQTAGMDAQAYVFDVQVTGGATSPYTPYSGTLLLSADVTRDG